MDPGWYKLKPLLECFLFSPGRVSPCNPDWPLTHNPLASAFQLLGLEANVTMPDEAVCTRNGTRALDMLCESPPLNYSLGCQVVRILEIHAGSPTLNNADRLNVYFLACPPAYRPPAHRPPPAPLTPVIFFLHLAQLGA